ncbi:MAG TPA: hypothetical protein VGG75_38165 [Trebonia sp.]|jgi:hypothetical protein
MSTTRLCGAPSTTRPGWSLNFAQCLWELHDERGTTVTRVTAELLALGPAVEELLEARFGVPFPKEGR